MPVSTASTPVFIGSTMFLPHNCANAFTNGPYGSEKNARDVSVTRPICSDAARTSAGCPCPKFTAE